MEHGPGAQSLGLPSLPTVCAMGAGGIGSGSCMGVGTGGSSGGMRKQRQSHRKSLHSDHSPSISTFLTGPGLIDTSKSHMACINVYLSFVCRIPLP
ncbi:hypothetical protein AALO_G00010790 [Alosa alosa]|uniref:Uncharacterized protein n=1 Tax=Alosa alosa TaxID=278164 RepID=A0AAV6HKU9_9TELE|nr:hypothetical protein AALO_G00010790 [Alosa alosa]